MNVYTVLVIVHVVLFAYWLGGDWGVYVNAKYVADPKLPLDERRRFLQASFRIDLMPRTAFPLLMAVGMQIAAFYDAWPFNGPFMIFIWIGALAWLAVNVAGYLKQGSPAGDRMRTIDQYVRMALAPTLIAVGGWSLIAGAPIAPKFIGEDRTRAVARRRFGLGFRRFVRCERADTISPIYSSARTKAGVRRCAFASSIGS